ncbi:MAG: DinB family protein [Thermoanaerobaculia bacterium]
MKRIAMGIVAACVLALATADVAEAGSKSKNEKADAAAQAAALQAAAAKADYLMLYDQVAKKIADLGAAIPEEKYDWRPAEGVRSVAEVLNHVSGASYLFGKVTGAAVPADAPADPEKGPDAKSKAEILAKLSEAIAYGRANAEALTPEQLAKSVDFFGNQMSVRALYMIGYEHLGEHLGQLIAYARMIGVKPPWSN